MSSLLLLFLSAALLQVLVAAHMPKWRPFIAVTNLFESCLGMAAATALVLPLSALTGHWAAAYLLGPFGLDYLRTLVFALLILMATALVERLFVTSARWPAARGSFAALLVGNGAILGVTWLGELGRATFAAVLGLSLGTALGFAFLLLALATMYERLQQANIPTPLRETPIALITAGMMALAFMGFSGLVQE